MLKEFAWRMPRETVAHNHQRQANRQTLLIISLITLLLLLVARSRQTLMGKTHSSRQVLLGYPTFFSLFGDLVVVHFYSNFSLNALFSDSGIFFVLWFITATTTREKIIIYIHSWMEKKTKKKWNQQGSLPCEGFPRNFSTWALVVVALTLLPCLASLIERC